MFLTKEDLIAISQLLDQKLEEKLSQKFQEELGPVNQRLDGFQEELGTMNQRLDGFQEELGTMNQRLDSMEEKLDVLDIRVGRVEFQVKQTEQTLKDAIHESENLILQEVDDVHRLLIRHENDTDKHLVYG